jgi:hypothetical protein
VLLSTTIQRSGLSFCESIQPLENSQAHRLFFVGVQAMTFIGGRNGGNL